MLFIENLGDIIFSRHELIESDELIILSGYVGPKPVEKLGELSISSKIIYGMYGAEGVKPALHNALLALQNKENNIDIFYSQLPVHAKCYLWRLKGKTVHALVGSANFSNNGLNKPMREVLAETTTDTFRPLDKYVENILTSSLFCLDAPFIYESSEAVALGTNCSLSLLDGNGNVPQSSGLNWGQNQTNHTNPRDSYIAIKKRDIRSFPELFPPKSAGQDNKDRRGRPKARNNDPIEILWDDGMVMEGLLIGNQDICGVVYPKQITSFPKAKILGDYLRSRIGVAQGEKVRKSHLNKYGKCSIEVSRVGEGMYMFDFGN